MADMEQSPNTALDSGAKPARWQKRRDKLRASKQRPRWLTFKSPLRSGCLRFGWVWSLFPWFITAPLGKTERRLPKVTSTTYLTGLRGIACLVVFNYHVYMSWYPYPTILAYGTVGPPGPAENTEVFQLPIFRLVWAGKAAVAIFFIISGFVLSYPFLRKVEFATAPPEEISKSLSSSIFRRPLRLFAPMFIAIILSMPFSYMYPTYFIIEPTYFAKYPGYKMGGDAYPSFLTHVGLELYESCMSINPFTWATAWPPSLPQAWTLPAEFRGSLIIFFLCLASWHLSTFPRKALLVSMAAISMSFFRWDVFLFVSGMVLADARVRPISAQLAHILQKIPRWVKILLNILVLTPLLLLSMVWCSWPDLRGDEVAPYKYFQWMQFGIWKDPNFDASVIWLFTALGSAGVMTVLESFPLAQALLSTTPIRYFGEVSFAFYMMHWAAIQVVGKGVNRWMTQELGWPQDNGFFIVYLSTFIVTLWTGDLFWRAVDENCVNLSRRVVSRLLSPEKSNKESSDEVEKPLLPSSRNGFEQSHTGHVDDAIDYRPLPEEDEVDDDASDEVWEDQPLEDPKPWWRRSLWRKKNGAPKRGSYA